MVDCEFFDFVNFSSAGLGAGSEKGAGGGDQGDYEQDEVGGDYSVAY